MVNLIAKINRSQTSRRMYGVALLLLLGIMIALAAAPPFVSAQGTVAAPAALQASNGPNPGETVLEWTPVDGASYYRIGWVAIPDYHATVAEGRDWLESFTFVSVAKTEQSTHTVTRLAPGVEYGFIVGSSTVQFGASSWSEWALLTLVEEPVVEEPVSCPTFVPEPDCVATGTCLRIREIGQVSGVGDNTSHVFDLQAGLYRFTLTGDYLVSAEMVPTTASRDIYYFDYISVQNGGSTEDLVTVDVDDAGTYILEIDADGSDSWQFRIVRISN